MTSIYDKLAFCGIFTNFRSLILKSYKYNLLLLTLLQTAFKLCLRLFLKIIPKVLLIFLLKIKVFIKKEAELKASKKELICILPYIGKKSLQLRICSVNSIESNFYSSANFKLFSNHYANWICCSVIKIPLRKWFPLTFLQIHVQ